MDCCPICLDDLVPDQPQERCNVCHNRTHRGCLIRWLNVRRNAFLPANCPFCRSNMEHLLPGIPLIVTCAICEERIGPQFTRLRCRNCGTNYHQNELVRLIAYLRRNNNAINCWNCNVDISNQDAALELLLPGDNRGIQMAELNNNINIFDSDSDSESEDESDTD